MIINPGQFFALYPIGFYSCVYDDCVTLVVIWMCIKLLCYLLNLLPTYTFLLHCGTIIMTCGMVYTQT